MRVMIDAGADRIERRQRLVSPVRPEELVHPLEALLDREDPPAGEGIDEQRFINSFVASQKTKGSPDAHAAQIRPVGDRHVQHRQCDRQPGFPFDDVIQKAALGADRNSRRFPVKPCRLAIQPASA